MKPIFVPLVVLSLVALSYGVTINPDQRLDGNVFYTFGNITSSSICGMICLQSSRCEAFNFRSVNSTCSLVDQRVNSTVLADVGYVYSDINLWDTTLAGPCNTKPCDTNSMCVQGTSSYSCVTAGWGLSM